MTSRTVSLALVSLLAFSLGADQRIPKDSPSADQAKLQGTWVVIDMQIGRESVDEDVERFTWTFKKEHLTLREGEDVKEVRFEVDEAKEPKYLTFANVKGIYRFENDLLHICISVGGRRPRTFTSTDDRNNPVFMVMKRKQ